MFLFFFFSNIDKSTFDNSEWFLATEHFDGGRGVWDVQDEVQVLFHNKTSLIPSADNKALSFQNLNFKCFFILVFNSFRYPFCEGSSCWRSLWGRENTMMSSYFPWWNKKPHQMNDSVLHFQYFLQLATTKIKSTDMNSLLFKWIGFGSVSGIIQLPKVYWHESWQKV